MNASLETDGWPAQVARLHTKGCSRKFALKDNTVATNMKVGGACRLVRVDQSAPPGLTNPR